MAGLVFASAAYDESFALRAAWYSSAAYCPMGDIPSWNCTNCKNNPGFQVEGVLFDASSNTFGYVGADHKLAHSMLSVCVSVS